MVKIPRHTRELSPYRGGKPISELAREKQLTRIVKLASNENPLGPSPRALAALGAAAATLHRYVDPRATELVAKMAERINKKPSQIIFGHGTDALLGYIVNAFSSEGDEVLTSQGTFIGIYVNTTKQARTLRQIPLRDYAFDLDSIADAVSEDTKIIYLANPNNPTGTMYTSDEFESFMRRIPADVLVIHDEAYAAYALEHDGYPDGLSYDYENVIVTRTLSKVYGLAGLRIGYAVGHEALVQELYKIKLPFEPNSFAQAAAIAALDDEEFLKRTLETNRRSITMFTEGFDRLGLEYVRTFANFVLLLLPSPLVAQEFYEGCLERGLIVRPVAPFGIPNGIRINSGTEEESEFALSVIEQVSVRLLHPAGD